MLPGFDAVISSNGKPAGEKVFRDPAVTANRDVPVHRWVPWIAGFSKDFVEDALGRFIEAPGTVLDPFAGVGTSLVEADIAGHEAVGFEINPYATFASRTKLKAHRVKVDHLRDAIDAFRSFGREAMVKKIEPCTVPPKGFRTRTPFYSPKVLHKVLLALDFCNSQKDPHIANFFRLAFASTMVHYSNYSYEPSLGRKSTVGRPEVNDFPVIETLTGKLSQMADDVIWYRNKRIEGKRRDGRVFLKSFFDGYKDILPQSVDLLVTSPP